MSAVLAVPMELELPPGALGPEPVTVDVRAHLVPHPAGLVLVDTGIDPSGAALEAALSATGATWRDVTHVVITHAHPDHTGALAHVRAAAPGAAVLAHPLEGLADTAPVEDGDLVAGRLAVVETPGHTAGHLSLLDEDTGVLLVGDCVGAMGGELVRAPAPFTADAARAEDSLARLRDFRGARMLFAHGPELADPWPQLDRLLGR